MDVRFFCLLTEEVCTIVANFEFVEYSKKETKIAKLTVQLKAYLPVGFERMVAELLLEYPIIFTITTPRSTKLGDYRRPQSGELKHRISVNGNLNSFSFLVTTLHEIAHLQAFVIHGNLIKPHGEEWKQTYRNLLWPAIQTGLLPKEIESALMKSLTNTKASSCSDTQLSRVLKQYDVTPTNEVSLEEIPKNATFVLQGKLFRKGDLRRTRFVCEEIHTKRKFLVHTLASVQYLDQ